MSGGAGRPGRGGGHGEGSATDNGGGRDGGGGGEGGGGGLGRGGGGGSEGGGGALGRDLGGRGGGDHRQTRYKLKREPMQRHRGKRNFGDGAQSEILGPCQRSGRCSFAAKAQQVSPVAAAVTPQKHSLRVDRRTTAPHGMHGAELDRLSAALAFMACWGSLWWATTEKGTSRDWIGELSKRIARLQRRHGLPAYSATVFETTSGLHAHVVFLSDQKIAQQLQRSIFGTFTNFDRVTAWQGLATKYLAKERTPQAGYGRSHMLGGRLRGSHRLDGGGDRVRLSPDLRTDAIAAGYIEPWQRTNAQRSMQRKPYRPRRLTRTAPRLAGQIPLLPELERPVSRLRNFRGGKVPAAVAREIEFRRRRRGWTQRELAAMIGCKQPQLSNALRGHDPVSSFVVNRLRDVFAKHPRRHVNDLFNLEQMAQSAICGAGSDDAR